MGWEIAGFGNALMDALVVVNDESWLDDLKMQRGVAHMVEHTGWEFAYEKIRQLKVQFESGGSCANSIATSALLGARSVFCGQVGDDQMGRLYASKMDQYCGGHRLSFSDQHPTGKCLSVISARDAERTMITNLGAAIAISELDAFVDPLGACEIGHYEGYMLLGPETRALVIEAMKLTKSGGGRVSLDVSDPFVVGQITDVIWELLETLVDIVFLNAEEALALTGLNEGAALDAIEERATVSTIVVKLGAKGSIIQEKACRVRVPAMKVKAVDTTGAGDAYAGGFLYGKVRGWSLEKCGQLASRVAALTVTQVGAVVREREALLEALHAVCAQKQPSTEAAL